MQAAKETQLFYHFLAWHFLIRAVPPFPAIPAFTKARSQLSQSTAQEQLAAPNLHTWLKAVSPSCFLYLLAGDEFNLSCLHAWLSLPH